MTYWWVGGLTACQVTVWTAWFIVEIVIHSMGSDLTTTSFLQLEITQSMQVYQYNGIILAGTIAALHLAASVKTRAARVASFVVQVFAFLAWFWELYFIIPTFHSTSYGANLFCEGSTGLVPHVSTCRLARAVGAFAVIMQFFQGIILIYSFVNMFIPPMLDDGTRKEIIEEDDAEVATVVAANPAGYEVINRKVGLFSYASIFLVLLSLTGYSILMYALIDVVNVTGFMYLNGNVGYANQLLSNNIAQLGDPILSINFRPLSIVLVFALATSAYACFRHNRGIQAGALFLTAITTLQWWSWIIEGGRYLHQYTQDANTISGQPANAYPALAAQRAMYAGACIILAGETLRIFTLLARYYTYVPVTRNNVIPTYIRSAFATANPVPVILFWCQVAIILAWFVLQFTHESDTGMWAMKNAPQNIPIANAVTDTLFIFSCLFFVSVFIPELFSERTKTLASKQAALAVNITVICAWFLIVWPWTYATIHRTGFWMLGGFFNVPLGIPPTSGLIPAGFCEANGASGWGYDNCRLAQGAAILCVISGFVYVFLAIYQLARILTMLPTPGQVATIDGTVVDALPPTVAIQKALGWNCSLLLVGLLIWALASINSGSGLLGFRSFTFGQLIGTPGIGGVGPTASTTAYNLAIPQPFLAYSYSIAFANLIIIGFTVWSASELASNPVVANWHAWRTLVTGLSGLLFSFFIPFFIMTCRYINWGILGATELAIASGVIIMCIGDFVLYASALITQRSPLIALPAAINNTAQPVKAAVPLQSVAIQQPGVTQTTTTTSTMIAGQPAAYGTYGSSAVAEPTQTTATAMPTRDYSGTQQPVQ